MTRLLLLEDEPALQRGISRHLERQSWSVEVCGTVAEARAKLAAGEQFHAALVDLWLPDGSGMDLLTSPPEGAAPLRAIVMTGDATVDTAVHALRMGVIDYLLKPFSMTALDGALARIVAHPVPGVTKSGTGPPANEREERARAWRAKHAPEMIGEHKSLLDVFDTLSRVAATDCAILVHGETGTGKELVARSIHAASGRGAKPFVAVNCAAVPEQLMESELFGHGRGAYTGATEKRIGKFAVADGGTLFLDEIGEMPLALQAKLLRVLQEKEITPLGENKAQRVDVRVVAATHRDLDALVSEGKFREDLLYRLDVIRLELPALRARPADVPALVGVLVKRANERRASAVTGVQTAAMEALKAYAWPGNVRQLQNAIERAVLLRERGELMLEDLPDRIRPSMSKSGAQSTPASSTEPGMILPEEGLDLKDTVERFEYGLIRQALTRTNWNKNRASALLKLSRTTLVEKLKRRGWLDDDSASDAGDGDEPKTGKFPA